MTASPLLSLLLLLTSESSGGHAPGGEGFALPEKVPPPDEPPPAVRIRRIKDAVVIEYRRGGRLWMVRVEPKNGVPYHLVDIDGDGRLDAKDSDLPIRPVYYTVHAWD